MAYSPGSIVVPTKQNDQSGIGMNRQHTPRLEKATEASSSSTATVTPLSYSSSEHKVHPGQERGDTSGCSVGQHSKQRNQPDNNNTNNNTGNNASNNDPTVYGLGSLSYAFYPYQNSPMYPFYHPQPGDLSPCGPFQTPPPPQQSQLASPNSHDTQESGRQTPFNPEAKAFQTQKGPDKPQEDQQEKVLEDFYNAKRGISRSLCDDNEYQSDLGIDAKPTHVRKDTKSVSSIMNVISAKPDSPLPSRSNIHSHRPLDVAQKDSAGNTQVADFKCAVRDYTPLSDLLEEKTGLEFNDQLEFAEKCKDKFFKASPGQAYAKGKCDFAARAETKPAMHRYLWSDEVEDASTEGDTTIKVESVNSGLSDVAIKTESDEGELRQSDMTAVPIKKEFGDEETKLRNIPHVQDNGASAARKPRSVDLTSEGTKKIFDDADFPALGSAKKKKKKNDDQVPWGRRTSAMSSTPESAAVVDRPRSPPLAAVHFRDPWTGESAPAPMSWSSIVSGKRSTRAIAAATSPVPPLASKLGKETPSPGTIITPDMAKDTTIHGSNNSEGPVDDKPTPTPTPNKPCTSSATTSLPDLASVPTGGSVIHNASSPAPAAEKPGSRSGTQPPEPARPRLWSQLVGGSSPGAAAPLRSSSVGAPGGSSKDAGAGRPGQGQGGNGGDGDDIDGMWPSLGAARAPNTTAGGGGGGCWGKKKRNAS
ncbi:hypothetical protein F5X99DRAFT_404602 [Biscogniauxia marginata]|nr:hypothetical protein F5X99DRAFT_404602 [Biscogniauxia marginata]